MADIKRIGGSGVHTVEGTVAGSRAAFLSKSREAEQANYEASKAKIKEQNSAIVGRIDDKFSSATDVAEHEFRKRTVGLVTADEFRRARIDADAAISRDIKTEEQKEQERCQAELEKKKDRAEKRKKIAAALSFDLEEDAPSFVPKRAGRTSETTVGEDTGEEMVTKKKVMKNPDVDTSFLPDRERDEMLEREKARLRQEWLDQQEVIKNESLEVVYSYWNGNGHRKSVTVKKNTTIGNFLEIVKQNLVTEFHELRAISADNLLYVKEDLIIPKHITFYDLIITKARGKSGPLFHFDVHDDVRLTNDARIEKDESHPGKVVERRWYEKNKHIFPASRWEIYDPTIVRDKYTVHGGEVSAKK